MNVTPLLVPPPAMITTLPVAAPTGTIAVTLVLLQEASTAATPLKVTRSALDPKPLPEITTKDPTAPLWGEREAIVGVSVWGTVNLTPLLDTPPSAVTTTFPVVVPIGTVVLIAVFAQLITVAGLPLKLTEPTAGGVPKLVPLIVTDAPSLPEDGERLVMFGGGVTVKLTPLLATLPAVITTFPVVAPVGTVAVTLPLLQEVTVAAVPLKVTVP